MKAIVVQLADGQGVLVRYDIEKDIAQVDVRDEEHHSWTPIPEARAGVFVGPKFRVENQ